MRMNKHDPSILPEDYASLSLEQKWACKKIQEGNNMFITGPGGTGKTKLIRALVGYMKHTDLNYQVCALTGCAALLLQCGAKTIHSWSGIRLAKGPTDIILNRIIKNRKLVAQWKKVDVLIVDEISMMSVKIFDLLDEIGRRLRRNPKPFGGIQLVFTGDFFQLPPIPEASDPASAMFCFESTAWSRTFSRENCLELTTHFRQHDPKYIEILQEIRLGKLSQENAELLQTYVSRPFSLEDHGGIAPTKLFPIRQKVEYVNATMYENLESEEREFHYKQKTNERMYLESAKPIPFEILIKYTDLSKTEQDSEIETMLASSQTDKLIRLKVGALVMCTINLDMESGICNGSQGIVIGFGANLPIVRFTNGRILTIDYQARQNDDYPNLVIAQIPLCLAWALTIHKIQGATLELAEMDIGKTVFEYGQTYVALSRIQSLDGLYLSEFNPYRIKANPDVVAFYESFPRISREEMDGFISKRETAELVKIDPTIKKIRI